MATVLDLPAGEAVAGSAGPVRYEDAMTGWVDLTVREDYSAVAGISLNWPGRDQGRIDDVEIPVAEGDSFRDLIVKAADLGRAALEAPPEE